MRQFSRGSLPLRVLVVCLLALALPQVVYLAFVFQRAYEARLGETVTRLRSIGEMRAEQLSQLSQANLRVAAVAEQLMIQENIDPLDPPPDKRFDTLLSSIAKGGGFASAFFLPIEGKDKYHVIASANPKILDQDYSSYHFVDTTLREGTVSFLAFGSSSFDKFFFVAKVVYDKEAVKPVGILVLGMAADKIVEGLIATEELGYPIDFSLLSSNRIVFASGDNDLLLRMLEPLSQEKVRELSRLNRFDASMLRPSNIDIKAIKGIAGAMTLKWGGVTRIGVEVSIEGTELSLLLTAKKADIFRAQYAHLWRLGGFFILILVIGFGVAFWLIQKMARPLKRLVDVMNRVSRGDLTARFKPHRLGFELNVLGEIFNQTIDSLRTQMTKAETERVEKESFRQELKIGREIQMGILPHTSPEIPGVEIAAHYVPAKQVGGDFYELSVMNRPNSEEKDLLLTVADASGKGVPACLYSLCLRSMIRSYSVVHSEVSQIMREANNLFCQDTGDSGMFVTALTAIYHPDTRLLTYTSCGHTPGLVVRADGSMQELTTGSMATGVIIFDELEEEGVQLASGDLVILYTDGLTEMHNEKNELYGEERFKSFVTSHRSEPVDDIVEGLVQSVTDFRGRAIPFDDITLIIMRVS